MPEKVLDAPDLLDDYYLHLLDWSSTNQLAVALGGSVYVWNASDGTIASLTQMESQEDYICSLAWVKEGTSAHWPGSKKATLLTLAWVKEGTSAHWPGSKKVRLLTGLGQRRYVCSLAWIKEGTLLTGLGQRR